MCAKTFEALSTPTMTHMITNTPTHIKQWHWQSGHGSSDIRELNHPSPFAGEMDSRPTRHHTACLEATMLIRKLTGEVVVIGLHLLGSCVLQWIAQKFRSQLFVWFVTLVTQLPINLDQALQNLTFTTAINSGNKIPTLLVLCSGK